MLRQVPFVFQKDHQLTSMILVINYSFLQNPLTGGLFSAQIFNPVYSAINTPVHERIDDTSRD